MYIGVTGDLARRIYMHKQRSIKGFTKRYEVDRLVYVETYGYVHDALKREKQLKKWNRAWKINLIEKNHNELISMIK